jgi:hypothetical protein
MNSPVHWTGLCFCLYKRRIFGYDKEKWKGAK